MNIKQRHTSSRRIFLACLAAGVSAPALPVMASDGNELDPSDTVPNRFSLERFTALDRRDIYDVALAVRRGRRIVIDGFSPSQSRRIIRQAADDWPTTRAALRSGSY